MLDEEKTRPYAVGLYMYAIEEYGKSEILKKHLNVEDYSIPQWTFGKGNDYKRKKAHDLKMGEGVQRIPADCRLLSPTGIRLEYNLEDKTITIEIKKNRIPVGSVSIMGKLSGL